METTHGGPVARWGPVGGPLGARWARCPLGARWGPVGGPLGARWGPVGPVARRARWARRARQGFGPSGGASPSVQVVLQEQCRRYPTRDEAHSVSIPVRGLGDDSSVF